MGFCKRAPMLGDAGIFLKHVYFWCNYIFFLLHLQVLSNHVALILHWCSNTNPCLIFRVNSAGLSLSVLLGHYYHSPGPNFRRSLFVLLKGLHSPVPENIISCFPQKEFSRCSGISFLSQYNHWVSFTNDHNIFWINYGPIYELDFLQFFLFGSLVCYKTVLDVGVFIWWVRGTWFFNWRNWWW